jgi:hypothetical protein
MAGLTITSVNATFLLTVPGIFSAPQQLQQFAVDEAFDTEEADAAEVQLGVDGAAASGLIPRLTPMTFAFLASSPSIDLFEQWLQAQDQARDVFYATGTLVLPSLQKQYNLPQGTLQRYSAVSNVRRVLQARRFRVVWAWPIVATPSG